MVLCLLFLSLAIWILQYSYKTTSLKFNGLSRHFLPTQCFTINNIIKKRKKYRKTPPETSLWNSDVAFIISNASVSSVYGNFCWRNLKALFCYTKHIAVNTLHHYWDFVFEGVGAKNRRIWVVRWRDVTFSVKQILLCCSGSQKYLTPSKDWSDLSEYLSPLPMQTMRWM